MNSYTLRNGAGLYLVLGFGFTAKTACDASNLTLDEASSNKACAQKMGIPSCVEPVKSKSFAVNYVRPDDLDGNGAIRQNAKNPSRRRFATREEAETHASRFMYRKAKGSRVEGSAGHVGAYVTESNDPVNAEVNPETGLTNSI